MSWQHFYGTQSPSESSSDLAQPATPSASNDTVHSPTEAYQSLPGHTNPLWPPLPRVGTPFSSTMSNLGPVTSGGQTDAGLDTTPSAQFAAQTIDVIEAVRQLQRLSLPLNNHGSQTGLPQIPSQVPPLIDRSASSFVNHPPPPPNQAPSSTNHTNANHYSHYANISSPSRAETTPVNLTSSEPIEKHPVYYFVDGNMDFQVNGVHYCVHQSVVSRWAPEFVERVMQYRANFVDDLGDVGTWPIQIKRQAIETLLLALYPGPSSGQVEETPYGWSLVLEFSRAFHSTAIHDLAMKRFSAIATPVEKITIGTRRKILQWTTEGFIALAARKEPLTAAEAAYLNFNNTVLVAEIRERILEDRIRTPSEGNSERVGQIVRNFLVEKGLRSSSCSPEDESETVSGSEGY